MPAGEPIQPGQGRSWSVWGRPGSNFDFYFFTHFSSGPFRGRQGEAGAAPRGAYRVRQHARVHDYKLPQAVVGVVEGRRAAKLQEGCGKQHAGLGRPEG